MSDKRMCPVCEEGFLNAYVDKHDVTYKGSTTSLEEEYSICGSCGCEQASPEQLRTNKRKMVEFKKEVDGLLTGNEIRNLRKALGVTQKDAGKIFGGGPVAFCKYEADEITQSDPMDRLLRVAREVPEAWEKLCEYANHELSHDMLYHTLERTKNKQRIAVMGEASSHSSSEFLVLVTGKNEQQEELLGGAMKWRHKEFIKEEDNRQNYSIKSEEIVVSNSIAEMYAHE